MNSKFSFIRQPAKLVLLITILFYMIGVNAHSAIADTVVGGPVISDTTWTLAGSPYMVTSSIEVMVGVTLTIEPGVVIKFSTDKLMLVDGNLIARGTPSSRIIFTSNLANPQPGDWGKVKFTDTSIDASFDGSGNYLSGSIIQYCLVEYGTGIEANSSSPYIDNCSFTHNGHVLLAELASIGRSGTIDIPMRVTNNSVISNLTYYGGINLNNAYIYNNSVNNNTGTGITATNSLIVMNSVNNNSGNVVGGGINAVNSTVTGNTVSGNTARTGGGMFVDNSVVTGNTVNGNHALYKGGGIRAENHSVVNGNSISLNDLKGQGAFNDGGGIYASYSTLNANTIIGNTTDDAGGGISADNCTITDNKIINNSASNGTGILAYNCQVSGNTLSGNFPKDPSSGGSGLILSGSNDFHNNTVVGNIASLPDAYGGVFGGIEIQGNSLSIPQLHNNVIYGNSPFDVVVNTATDVNATNNYWGTNDNVNILAHVYDYYDDAKRGRLLTVPFLQDPDANSPVPPPGNLKATFSDQKVLLSWDAIPSTTTGYGYKIYYKVGNSGPPYNGAGLTQGNSPINVGNVTQFTLSKGGGSVYYFTVTAFDTLGHESWYSNEVNTAVKVYLPSIRK